MSSIKVKEFKELGWADVKVSSTAYTGGVQEYTGTNGKVGVFFTLKNAYVIEDDQGLFFTKDYMHMVKQGESDMFTPQDIDGATIIAMIEENEVAFADKQLERLGIDTLEVRQDIQKKLLHLTKLDEKLGM